jgi:HK97 family phage prohead protease
MTIDERRTLSYSIAPVELRADEDGRSVAVGYAAKFGERSLNLGGFVEEIAPTAFTKTVTESDVVALRDHDGSRLLGRMSAGTLRLTVDSIGLRYEIDLPDTSEGRDTALLLARGDLAGSSFGFRTVSDGWDKTDDGYPLRILKEVALRDIGPTTFPAYTSTEASLRCFAEQRNMSIGDAVAAAAADQLRDLISLPDIAPAASAPVFHRPQRY